MPLLRVKSFQDLIRTAALEFAGRPFLIDDELLGTVSYSRLAQFAGGLERSFDELGIPLGAPVATIFHNCGLAALLFLAVMASRRMLIPLSPLSSQDELTYMLDRAGCAAVLFDPTHCRVPASGMGGRLSVPIIDHRSYVDERSIRGGADTVSNSAQFVGEVVFTSGSTGRPKGVVLSESNLLANAEALAQVYGLASADRFLTVCPLFHNSGQVFTTLACALVGGSTAAVKSDVGMLHFWRYVRRYEAHWSLGMVSFLALLLSQPGSQGPEKPMRGFLTGGSAIDAALIQGFERRFGVPVSAIYGLTESSSIATCEPLDSQSRSLGSSGPALPICDVRIGPELDRLAVAAEPAAQQRAEIWISGPTVFQEYLGDPELTRSVKQQGWLRTGDVGYFDASGNLFIVDRLDSMLIVGGENVYPAEIERLGALLPGAAQVVLAGIDHDIWRTQLVLVYKAVSPGTVSPAQWHRILAQHVAAHKIPQHYVAVEELGLPGFPRRANGKLDRQKLTKLLKRKFARRTAEVKR
ncbi:MAG TPA: class I adenylate-forming enzyme family protein [Steroidobacteraceae bacterium]